MRSKNLLLGIAISAFMVGAISHVLHAQEEGRRGGDRGTAPGGGGRGGPPGGFGGRGSSGIMGLLRMEEVQKELKLTDDQKKELLAFSERLRESMGSGGRGPGGATSGRPEGGRPEGGRPEGGRTPGAGISAEQMTQFRETMARMAEARNKAEQEIMTTILDPDQGDRILGLLIQKEDGQSLSSNVLADALALSPEQKQQVKTVTDNNGNERMKMMESVMRGGGGFSQELRDQMEGLSKKLNTELIAVMTPDQKAKFESMKGEKFTFPEQRGFGGGPGGGDRTRGAPGGEGGRPSRPAGPEN